MKGMQRRNAQQKGIKQMIEILDGERKIPYEQLVTLSPSLQRLMIRDCPTFPLMEKMRQVMFPNKEERDSLPQGLNFVDTSKENLTAAADAAYARLDAQLDAEQDRDPLGVNPWRSVAHLAIRVPDHLKALYTQPVVSRRAQESEAAKKVEEEENRLKRDMGMKVDVSDLVGKKREKKKEKEDEPMEADVLEEDPSTVDEKFLIHSIFDNRRPWIIPPKARAELATIHANWSIDEHFLPSCSTSPFVIVCIKSSYLLVNPLRICLPSDYPESPITVQFDQSFPETSEGAKVIQKLYERNLATRTAPTLTDFVEMWQTACEEYQVFVESGSVPASFTEPILQTISDFERAQKP